ncbi:MAG: hypothetical protein JWO66_1452 [Candidatus Eremiobacteraeota bacterium]|nr:hypothetical protein [Candidatus Eremiobacteraeota bacterium]
MIAAVPDVVARAAAAFADTSHGVIVFRSHAVVNRPLQRAEVDDAAFVFVDGRKVSSSAANPGGPASAEAVAHQPYDPRYVAEYRYASTACVAPCPSGAIAVSFDAVARDAMHGHGVMVVDPVTAHILRTTTIPYVVPSPARSGTLVTTWGATPAGWFPIATTGTFIGQIGPFRGHATLTQTFTGYARYPSVAAAQKALPQG